MFSLEAIDKTPQFTAWTLRFETFNVQPSETNHIPSPSKGTSGNSQLMPKVLVALKVEHQTSLETYKAESYTIIYHQLYHCCFFSLNS
jgi:hypothetical protein